jgi:hypothetical protein
MQFLVQKYLSKHYYVGTSNLGNDGIYSKDPTKKYLTKKYPAQMISEKLLNELTLMFNLEESILKTYVQNWAESQRKDIDLEFYWLTLLDVVNGSR